MHASGFPSRPKVGHWHSGSFSDRERPVAARMTLRAGGGTRRTLHLQSLIPSAKSLPCAQCDEAPTHNLNSNANNNDSADGRVFQHHLISCAVAKQNHLLHCTEATDTISVNNKVEGTHVIHLSELFLHATDRTCKNSELKAARNYTDDDVKLGPSWDACLEIGSNSFPSQLYTQHSYSVFKGADIHSLLRPFPHHLSQSLEGVRLESCTAAALSIVGVYDGRRLNKIHIYLDGSGGSKKSERQDDSESSPVPTWGFCAIGEDEGGHFLYVGALAGAVIFDPEHPHYIGAEAIDGTVSMAAEMSAMCWSILWTIQSRRNFDTTTFAYWYEYTSVAGIAFQHFQSSSQVMLADYLRNLAILLSNVMSVHHFHVHGHSGHPWNELADKLCDAVGCKHAHKSVDSAHAFANFRFPVAPSSHDVHWMSLAGLASERLVEYPPGLTTDGTLDLKNLEINHYLPAQIIAGHVDAERNSGLSAINTQPVRLRLLGHNALTLKSYRKFTIAFAQIEQKGYHLAGFQESRKQKTGKHYVVDKYTDNRSIACHSCAMPNGSLGCSILISASRPFFYHGRTKVRVTTDDVIVHTSDPRRLIVIITTAVCRFAVASLHAPDQSHDECLTWWRDTTALFSHDLKHIAKIVFIDSNITLPSVWDLREPNHVDKKSMPSNVLNAGIFDELIHSAGLWVPAALPSSWREPDETLSDRLDVYSRSDRGAVDRFLSPFPYGGTQCDCERACCGCRSLRSSICTAFQSNCIVFALSILFLLGVHVDLVFLCKKKGLIYIYIYIYILCSQLFCVLQLE